jgi:murein DD-endopeptidase MepM/ murein hydrolase activator NlpD
MALADLPNLVSNPYHPPRPGFDDPHAGVDLAVMLPGSRVAVSGSPVMAAFAGRVIMTTANRFPFGNAIIIETPLDAPAVQALSGAAIPTPAPTLPPLSALTCPPYPPLAGANHAERSLYILYAHLRDAPAWQQGDPVTCGQEIGAVGDSGNALNPHLHFETRAGPAGMRLGPMAHYDASASSEEMASYCQWSVSGLFQLIDPLQVLGALPGQAQ